MFSTYHVLYNLIFAIMLLDFQQVVAEIQHVKATLLSQEHNDHAASPVQAISEALPETETRTQRAFKYSYRKRSGISHYTKIHNNFRMRQT